jgi:hypothetical protein
MVSLLGVTITFQPEGEILAKFLAQYSIVQSADKEALNRFLYFDMMSSAVNKKLKLRVSLGINCEIFRS